MSTDVRPLDTQARDSEPRVPPERTTSSVVWLIARREIVTRVRSKAFRLTTLITVIGLVGGILLVQLVGGDGASKSTVAFTEQTSTLSAPLRSVADAVGEQVTTRSVADDAAGEKLVRNGDADAFVSGTAEQPVVVVERHLSTNLQSAFNVLQRQRALNEQITAAGGDPGAVNEAVAGATVDVRSLKSSDDNGAERIVLGLIVGVLIYLSLLVYGPTVAQGVVEEKTSRVVELLLASVRPWQLMASKVMGIGIVGLAQFALIGVVGAVAAAASGALSISVGSLVSAVLWAIVWFLLGFVIYALLFAAAGALVSRQEDVGSVTFPLLAFIILPYVLGVSLLPGNPESGLIEVLSLFPFFAPMLMPWRIAMDAAPVWEMWLALVLAVALIPLLVALTGRIYQNAVLRTGARVKARDALKAL